MQKNVSMHIPLTDNAQPNSTSTCDSGATEALLYVVPAPPPDRLDYFPYYILFNFTGVSYFCVWKGWLAAPLEALLNSLFLIMCVDIQVWGVSRDLAVVVE